MVDFVYPDGCEADWGGDFVAKYCRCGVAEVGVDELAGDYSVAEKGLVYLWGGGKELVRLRGREGRKKVRYGLRGEYRRGRRWMRHRTCSANRACQASVQERLDTVINERTIHPE